MFLFPIWQVLNWFPEPVETVLYVFRKTSSFEVVMEESIKTRMYVAGGRRSNGDDDVTIPIFREGAREEFIVCKWPKREIQRKENNWLANVTILDGFGLYSRSSLSSLSRKRTALLTAALTKPRIYTFPLVSGQLLLRHFFCFPRVSAYGSVNCIMTSNVTKCSWFCLSKIEFQES